MGSSAIWIIALLAFLFMPFIIEIRRRNKKALDQWESDAEFVQITFGGKNYPIRREQLPEWNMMNRSARREAINNLQRDIDSGKLVWEFDQDLNMWLLNHTDKGRKIRFDGLDYYKVKK